MSTKKTSSKSKSISRKSNPAQIIGVVLLLVSVFLFISFVSYLFTWQNDQDLVLRFSWDLMFQSNVKVENWFGRLGAIVSNGFFYWGIGLPSFLVVYTLSWIGYHLLIEKKPKRPVRTLANTFIVTIVSSIYLAFLFRAASFPAGGIFGNEACDWMQSFIGTIGMIVVLFFGLFALIIWYFNPDISQFNLSNFMSSAKSATSDVASSTDKIAAIKTVINDTVQKGKEKRERILQELKEDEEEEEFIDEIADLNKPKSVGLTLDYAGDLEEEVSSPEASAVDSEELDLEIMAPPVMETVSDAKIPEHVRHHGLDEPYNPNLELSGYVYPTLELLHDHSEHMVEVDRAELEANKDQIIATLAEYKIEITKIRATVGPTVTLYEIIPAAGVRISRIKNLEDDIALKLSALGIRIIAPIPGKGTIGIEVPNKKRQVVSLMEVLRSEKFQNTKMDLPIALGKTISNEVFVADLAKMPHLLIAGATGQGKSVGINAVLNSILYKKHPSEVKLVLIDPKKVELFPYAKLENHFLGFLPGQHEPIVTETKKVIHTLKSLCIEMDQRYDLLKKAEVRNIKEYNTKFVNRQLNPEKGHKFLPFIVLVIDEFADLIMTAGKEVELPIGRLAQLARAIGIHLIIATQRPSVNIITGVIKANFPARLAFKVSSKFDSRTILDAGGADQLVGQGDMLLSVGADTIRLQCAFVDTPEVENVINHISGQKGFSVPYFLPECEDEEGDTHGLSGVKYTDLDDLFEDAAKLVVMNQHGSTSMIQRRLKLGYNRAGRIMDQLEAMGIVGAGEGSKPREVLVSDEVELYRFLGELKETR